MSSSDDSERYRSHKKRKTKHKKKHKKKRKKRKEEEYEDQTFLSYHIDRVPFKDAMYYGRSDPSTVPVYERFRRFKRREKQRRYFECKSLSPIVSTKSSVNESLAKMLKSNPKDVKSWIRFARESESQERALSILDKALEKCPGNTTLIRARLLCLERVKGYKAARQNWNHILHSSALGKDVDMWLRFVDFTQRSSSGEVVLLNEVTGMLTNALFVTGCRTNRFSMRLASYLHISGHVSESVSLVRALVEFAYFRPDGIEDVDSLTWFEAYWIGHDEGESWSVWYTKQLEGRFDDDDESSNTEKIKAKSWSEWIELERRRTRPERRVEFKTLKPFLRIETTCDLIFQLLRMYGVEVAWRVSSWDDVYSRDRIGREEYRYSTPNDPVLEPFETIVSNDARLKDAVELMRRCCKTFKSRIFYLVLVSLDSSEAQQLLAQRPNDVELWLAYARSLRVGLDRRETAL